MTARNTHLAALGLVRNPFPGTPDAGCYFSTPHLEEQMVELAHCVQARKGFSLLTAEVGMGKSTLVRRLMTDLAARQVVSALVFNTFLQGPELLAAVLQDFGLPSGGTMSADIAELNAFLLKNHAEGKTCLLIIDDAQNLSESSLELVRLLCNLETDQEKLLQIMLAGQPELEETLSRHNLRQLRSRVVKHARLHGLNSTEIADYVRFRFESAGSDGQLVLQADACQMLWQETQGVPRQVHLILDRCLYGLAAKAGNVIDPPLMREAIEDCRVDLVGMAPAAAPLPPPARPDGGSALRWAGGLALLLVAGLIWVRQDPAALQGPLGRVLGLEQQAQAAPVVIPARVDGADTDTDTDTAMLAAARPSAGDEAEAFAPVAMNAQGDATDTTAAGACGPRVAWFKDSKVISQPLPDLTRELLGSRLARQDGVCNEVRAGQAWLTWATPIAGYDLDNRLTAARFQIALTVYGSLLPEEVDGMWGEKSRGALKQFQDGIGLAPTGDIDAMSGLLLERFYVQEQ